jgi:hypothetical protein
MKLAKKRWSAGNARTTISFSQMITCPPGQVQTPPAMGEFLFSGG